MTRREFLEEVVDLLSEEGTAVLFSSHNLQEVERVAGRIGILHDGRLVLEGDVADLREHSCRVLVDGVDSARASALKDCVRTQSRDGSLTLTFLCDEPEARRRVTEGLGVTPRQSAPMSLEDLFVDVVGGRK